jgi:hypothetical protein
LTPCVSWTPGSDPDATAVGDLTQLESLVVAIM